MVIDSTNALRETQTEAVGRHQRDYVCAISAASTTYIRMKANANELVCKSGSSKLYLCRLFHVTYFFRFSSGLQSVCG